MGSHVFSAYGEWLPSGLSAGSVWLPGRADGKLPKACPCWHRQLSAWCRDLCSKNVPSVRPIPQEDYLWLLGLAVRGRDGSFLDLHEWWFSFYYTAAREHCVVGVLDFSWGNLRGGLGRKHLEIVFLRTLRADFILFFCFLSNHELRTKSSLKVVF